MTTDTKTTSFNFPFEQLTRIPGEPNNATITILKRQIYANAMENQCILGCGVLGYLGIIMPEADYRSKQLAVTPGTFQPFVKPVATVPKDDDSVDTIEGHKEEMRQIRDYNAMESKLKQQLLAAIEPTFITALEDAEVGFAMVTSKQILQHLITEYGIITLDELATNIEVLHAPWNSEQPIRMLWDRIKECQRVGTAGGEPISDKMAMYAALKLLDGTGLYATYTTGWRQAHPVQTTWTMITFQEFFNHADKDRKKHLTTKDAGFHGANATTKTYKAAVTNETTGTTTEAPATRTTTNFVDPTSGRKIYYCWSHGGSTNPKHTSETCTRQKDNHKKEATWFDMMGGCCEMNFGKNKKPTTTNSGN